MIIENFKTNKINNIYKISLNMDYDTFLNSYKNNKNINFIINKYDKDNLLIEQNYKIGIDKNTRHDILGTPNDLEKINV